MAMRIEIQFARPLDKSAKLRFLLAVATLAKSDRISFIRGDHAALVIGEGLSTKRLNDVLRDEGFPIESMRSSLDEEHDAQLDDIPGERGERVKPIGR